jgi:hypothetical protein
MAWWAVTASGVAAIVLTLGACGGDDEGGAAADALRESARNTVAAGTAQVTYDVEGDVGERVAFSGEEGIDFETEEAQGDVLYEGFPGLPPNFEAELYTKRDALYLRADAIDPDVWLEVPPDPLSQISTNPTGLVEAFDVALENVEETGTETIDGDEATAYEADYDIERLLTTLSDEEAERFEERLQALEGTEMALDVLVDADGLIRRAVFDMAPLLPEEASFVATTEFSDFGEPVTIDPPDPDDVQTLRQFRGQ